MMPAAIRAGGSRCFAAVVTTAIVAQVLPGTSTAAGPASGAPAGWPAVLTLYRGHLGDAGIVGSSLLLVRDGQVVAHASEGHQDLDARVPTDALTIYHWASVTKTLTGIAIMQLRDHGRLTLDDPVVKHIPELRAVHSAFGDISQVQIRHLMSHSAGFRASTWPWGGDQPWHPFEPSGWNQIVAMLPYTELIFAPGTQYAYSNLGVVFLGRIIELLSGDDYEVYVTKNILMPLEMHRSFFDRAPYHLLSHRSHSYFRTDGGLREARFDFDTGITVSNGGLNATLGDMAKYLAFLIGSPARPHYEAVLRRRSVEEMFVPQVRGREGEGASGPDVQASLSFFVERHGNIELVGHSGDQNGFVSHLYLHLPSRTGYLVAYNTDASARASAPARPGTREVDASVRDAIVREVLSRGEAPGRQVR